IVPLDDAYSDTGSVQTTQATQDATQATQDATQATAGADCSIETRIMNVMLQKPTISQKEIASLLQENPNTVKYYIRKLKEVGRIERQGSSQKGKWIVK
ncbi:MAG: winged helix-turn-helix domain-containing protein, partial [Fusicatenibacter sp.]